RPARIAVDLKDTQSGLSSRNISLGSGNAQSMTVVETKDRTRLIFNLVELSPYETRRDGDSLVLTIGAAEGAPAVATPTSSATAAPATSSRPAVSGLAGVDFRRGENGEGRVIVDLGSANVPVDLS